MNQLFSPLDGSTRLRNHNTWHRAWWQYGLHWFVCLPPLVPRPVSPSLFLFSTHTHFPLSSLIHWAKIETEFWRNMKEHFETGNVSHLSVSYRNLISENVMAFHYFYSHSGLKLFPKVHLYIYNILKIIQWAEVLSIKTLNYQIPFKNLHFLD